MRRLLRERQSLLIAAGVTVALLGWLLSGGGTTSASPESAVPAAFERPAVTRVRVRVVEAQPISRDVVIYGRTEPSRAVTLRAEIDGRVVGIGAARGARVRAGDTIVDLDIRDREARLQQARAAVTQTELQYRAAKRLVQKSFQSETAVAEALANLEAARAAVKRVEVEVANARVSAPFEGVVDRRMVEIGDYVADGNEIARILDLDPILVTGDITQRELEHVQVRARGFAQLVTGEQLEGRVRYVAAEADPATRTFRVELEVPNPTRSLVSGITAEIRIPTRTLAAHFLSPALLSLDDDDTVGVKCVDDSGRVVFHPVEIVRASADGMWVTGLPAEARVITVGQGFVRAGDAVETSPETPTGTTVAKETRARG
ncbi:MAG: efflux RND transporter periplasmic adaptor subunit [Gammaproteobacteria bacterium]|nr:efflux RND transporter periplasmic adaptor subunit [Gammaproteobacteria bacterium]